MTASAGPEPQRSRSITDRHDQAVAGSGAVDGYAADLRDAKVEHERIVRDAAGRMRERGRRVEAEARAGDAAVEIVTVATEQEADLIVLGSRGRTGLSRLLLGSVARNVVSGSTASVLIVRDGTEASAH